MSKTAPTQDETWSQFFRRPRRPRTGETHQRPPQSWRGVLRQAARPRRTRARRGVAVRDPGLRAQRVIVKTEVVRMGHSGHRSLKGWLHDHLDYLERDDTSRDGTPGQLYGREGVVDTEQFLDRATRDPRHFTVVVSPERGQDLDLTGFTRDLMRQVERDVGTGLDWAAANHYDTDHPHSHIIIRGRDMDGDPVFLDRQYLHEGIRYRAQEIATRELGWRWEQHIDRERGQVPTRGRDDDMDMDV